MSLEKLFSPSQTRKLLWIHWKQSPITFAIAIFCQVAVTILDVITPVLAGFLIDSIFRSPIHQRAVFFVPLVSIFGVIVALQLARYIQAVMWNKLITTAVGDMHVQVFANVQRRDLRWHHLTATGAVVRKISRGIGSANTAIDLLILGIIPALIASIGIVTTLILKWPHAGIGAGIFLLLLISTNVVATYIWLIPKSRLAKDRDTDLGAFIYDSLSLNVTVKEFSAEASEDARLSKHASKWVDSALDSWTIAARIGFAQGLFLAIFQISLLAYVMRLWSAGQASVGDVGYVLSIQFVLSGYLRNLSLTIRNFQRAMSEVQDVLLLSDESRTEAVNDDIQNLACMDGDITFENVHFTHYGRKTPLLKDFNLKISAGQRVGIVGLSGSGKTTITRLIQRLYTLDEGRITIGDVNINEINLIALRKSIACVGQEFSLFNRTIAENIALGEPAASLEDVIDAATRARAHDFIKTLAFDYQTIVGERGATLSGGQRQRIAIARAILNEAPILIFDEATSNLDSATELLIRETIESLSKNKTTIVVAHRIATVKDLDRIIVLRQGQIIEDGTHLQLVSKPKGLYQQLCKMQGL